jgi:hypothetical protein
MAALAAGWLVLVTALVVALWFILLLVSIARSSTKQGWLDRAARTVVTKTLLRAPTADPAGEGPEARVR